MCLGPIIFVGILFHSTMKRNGIKQEGVGKSRKEWFVGYSSGKRN